MLSLRVLVTRALYSLNQ